MLSHRKAVYSVGGVLLIGIAAFGAYFGPQIVKYLQLRPRLTESPLYPRGWDSSPRPLTETAVSAADRTTLTYYGYTIEVPWKGIAAERNPLDWEEIEFKDGHEIKFVDPSYFRHGTWNYEKMKAVLSMTPSQISPFCSHRVFAEDVDLLGGKGTMFEHYTAAPDIFSVQTTNYRGFEVSGLARGWEWVQLTLFDSSGGVFEFTISAARDSTKITQPEINLIIQSLAPSRSKSQENSNSPKVRGL